MSRRVPPIDSQDWREEDFFVHLTPSHEEDDPWSNVVGHDKVVASSTDGNPALHDVPVGEYQAEERESIEEGSSDKIDDDVIGISKDDWTADALDVFESGEEIPATDYNGVHLYIDDEMPMEGHTNDSNESEWDEPEPQEEYDSQLSEPTYSSNSDEDASDLSRKLKIGELIASVDATDTQRTRIAQLLDGFSSGRLRYWLSWMRKQGWTGRSLLLFLEFRGFWDTNPKWWEYSLWNEPLNCWYVYQSSSCLTLDMTYSLIQSRLHCRPHHVIDEAWFEDWDYFALWRREFSSFALFVLYRAGLQDDEDWQNGLNLPVEDPYDYDELPYWRQSDDYQETLRKFKVVWNGKDSLIDYDIWHGRRTLFR